MSYDNPIIRNQGWTDWLIMSQVPQQSQINDDTHSIASSMQSIEHAIDSMKTVQSEKLQAEASDIIERLSRLEEKLNITNTELR